jgi:hypothetical protein
MQRVLCMFLPSSRTIGPLPSVNQRTSAQVAIEQSSTKDQVLSDRHGLRVGDGNQTNPSRSQAKVKSELAATWTLPRLH